MTNEELLEKMKHDLNPFEDYCPGLHNIGLAKYKIVTESPLSPLTSSQIAEFTLTKETITEEDIAEQILASGLKVIKTHLGLSSTVTNFHNKLNPGNFDYNYNSNTSHVCNVIIARPNYIIYKGEKYLLGDLNSIHNVGNKILFNSTLSPAFIYGYYTKKILGITQPYSYLTRYIYEEQLTLHENPTFWAYLSSEEREAILSQIFQKKTGALASIKLANNNRILPILFKTPTERNDILSTRKQIKRKELKRN